MPVLSLRDWFISRRNIIYGTKSYILHKALQHKAWQQSMQRIALNISSVFEAIFHKPQKCDMAPYLTQATSSQSFATKHPKVALNVGSVFKGIFHQPQKYDMAPDLKSYTRHFITKLGTAQLHVPPVKQIYDAL